MRQFILALPFLGLAACVETNEPTVAGATVGAVAGAALADDDDRLEGAAIGAVVGGVAGNLLGRTQNDPNRCVYQDSFGNRYVDRCP